jgi:hypothetical protein
MKLLTKIKLIAAVRRSDLPNEDKRQITYILLTHSLEKSLPLILKVIGTATEIIFKLFSQ